jgi:hypothetical protein
MPRARCNCGDGPIDDAGANEAFPSRKRCLAASFLISSAIPSLDELSSAPHYDDFSFSFVDIGGALFSTRCVSTQAAIGHNESCRQAYWQ